MWRPILIAANTAAIDLLIVGCDIPDISPNLPLKSPGKPPKLESTCTGTGITFEHKCGIIPKVRALADENITFHEKIPAVAKKRSCVF